MKPADNIRTALIDRLRRPGAWLRQEHAITAAGIVLDLLDATDVLHGYEIKSERDSLRRLTTTGLQIYQMSNALERCTLVCAPKHLQRAMDLLPQWWGVILTSDGLHTVREPRDNPTRYGMSFEWMLHVTEIRAILDRHGVNRRGASGKRALVDRLLEGLDESVLRAEIRTAIRTRTYEHGTQPIVVDAIAGIK